MSWFILLPHRRSRRSVRHGCGYGNMQHSPEDASPDFPILLTHQPAQVASTIPSAPLESKSTCSFGPDTDDTLPTMILHDSSPSLSSAQHVLEGACQIMLPPSPQPGSPETPLASPYGRMWGLLSRTRFSLQLVQRKNGG